MKRLSIIVLTATLFSCSQSHKQTDDSNKKSLKDFIYDHYSILNESSGDINLDGLTDKILVLKKDGEDSVSNYAGNQIEKRPLLLLLGQSDGSFKFFKRNDNAVYCFDCGGISGDPFIKTYIKEGIFTIEHGVAGGQHWGRLITFKFDKSKEDCFLQEDHFKNYKLNDSEDENADALVVDADKLKTSKDFGVVPFEKFDIYKE